MSSRAVASVLTRSEELHAALGEYRKRRAALLIARLDNLARNVAFTKASSLGRREGRAPAFVFPHDEAGQGATP
jgi:hypothetical protein